MCFHFFDFEMKKYMLSGFIFILLLTRISCLGEYFIECLAVLLILPLLLFIFHKLDGLCLFWPQYLLSSIFFVFLLLFTEEIYNPCFLQPPVSTCSVCMVFPFLPISNDLFNCIVNVKVLKYFRISSFELHVF
jgi:hypothetical protein